RLSRPGGGGRAARRLVAVQGPPATEDAVDGPHRGDRDDPLVQEGLADGLRPEGPQVALGQLPPCLQHQILHGDRGATRTMGRPRAVREVHPIQPLALGSRDPMGHRCYRDAELPGDRAQRLAATHGSYHGLTTLGLTRCLLIRFPPVGSLLGAIVAPLLFGMYWHKTVRDVLALTQLGEEKTFETDDVTAGPKVPSPLPGNIAIGWPGPASTATSSLPSPL